MQKDRQTDMTKLIVAFCNFANVSKNVSYPWLSLIIVILMPCVFLKTSFHSGRIKGMYISVCVCVCVCVYLAKCLPQNDGLYTHHGQPLQSYSMPSTRIKFKKLLFFLVRVYVCTGNNRLLAYCFNNYKFNSVIK